MTDGPLDLDDLIRAHRKGVRLSTEQRGRNRARILRRAAASAALATGAVGTTATAVATSATHGAATLVAKIVIGLVAIGGAGTAYYASRRVSTADHSISARVEPTLPAPPAEPPPEVEAPASPAAATAGSTIARPAAKSKAETAGSLAAEVQLLHDVEAALQAGQPARALQLLDAQRGGRYAGAMGEERAAARVVTLCKLGRVEEARAEAARFVRERPRSPLVERVRSTCAKGGEPTSADGAK
jgi:hypothetical protein